MVDHTLMIDHVKICKSPLNGRCWYNAEYPEGKADKITQIDPNV
jgi:hypothetical protein